MKRIAKDLRKCSIHQLFPLSPISGNWYLRLHFVPQPPFVEMSFWSAEKTAEAVEMELVVCRCMREWDYPSVMSALLNTITLYRSDRDLERIYCLLICVCKLGLYAHKWECFIKHQIWSSGCGLPLIRSNISQGLFVVVVVVLRFISANVILSYRRHLFSI